MTDCQALENAVRKFLAKYEGNKAAQLGNGAARRFYDEAKAILNPVTVTTTIPSTSKERAT